jgi:glutathione S-transferase
MEYVDINQAIEADGLRIILVQGMPSPWGQAAKAMMEYKDLDYIAGPQRGGGANAELVAWSGVNSAPVVAWQDENPLNRWVDILLLLERLAPEKPLVPQDPSARVQFFGLAHEICGELGFGWNRRLDMIHPGMKPGEAPKGLGAKYGYNEIDGALAASRLIAFMEYLAETLKAQAERGSNFLIGHSVTAADFYWAAFSNLVAIQPPHECPLDPAVRPMFENVSAEVGGAVDPILIEHRDRIMRAHFRMPMEL